MEDHIYRNFQIILKAFCKYQIECKKQEAAIDKYYLTPQRIVSRVKQGGDSPALFNSTIVRQVISTYKAYFPKKKKGKYYEYYVDWVLLLRDHPEIMSTIDSSTVKSGLCGIQEGNAQTTLEEFCDQAIEALENEYRDAKYFLLSNPVIVQSCQAIEKSVYLSSGTMAINDARIYEANLEYRQDETPVIPEGVPVQIRWVYSGSSIPAKLLQWDMPHAKAYLEFPRPLTYWECNNKSRIELTTHELIIPLIENLRKIKALREPVFWNILSNTRPRPLIAGVGGSSGHLDESQLRAIRKAVGHDYSIIWGPPGTGKTYMIGCLLCELAMAGKRILATSISNIAVDNMAIKFVRNLKSHYSALESDFESSCFLRYGYTRNIELSCDFYKPLFSDREEMTQLLRHIRQIKEKLRNITDQFPLEKMKLNKELDDCEKQRIDMTKQMVAKAKVVFTTAAQVYINPVFEVFMDYDVVVVDEASMMGIPIFSAIAARSRAQIVIVGDFRQLAPIAISQSEISRRYLHKSPFEWLNIDNEPNHAAMEMLMTQRRMAPSISDWVSMEFYDSKLNDDPIVTQYYDIRLPSDLPSKLVICDISNSRHKTVEYSAQYSQSFSHYNLGSAKYVTKIALLLKNMNPTADVAIISTYREQTYKIRHEIERLAKDHANDIQIGTVHTFQGSEADIVIWDTVDTIDIGLGQPYMGHQGNRLTNVAVSRAKRLMIVVCDKRVLKKEREQSTTDKYMNLLRKKIPCENIIDKWI